MIINSVLGGMSNDITNMTVFLENRTNGYTIIMFYNDLLNKTLMPGQSITITRVDFTKNITISGQDNRPIPNSIARFVYRNGVFNIAYSTIPFVQ